MKLVGPRLVDPASRGRLLPGAALVLIGLVWLVASVVGADSRIIPGAVGICLMSAYAFRRSHALLAAGSVLTGLGAGILLNDATGGRGMAIVTGLGLGFVAIFAVDALHGLHEAHWWPLIPGTILVLTGLELDMGTPSAQTWLGDWWPLALIAIGVVLIVRVAGRPKASA